MTERQVNAMLLALQEQRNNALNALANTKGELAEARAQLADANAKITVLLEPKLDNLAANKATNPEKVQS